MWGGGETGRRLHDLTAIGYNQASRWLMAGVGPIPQYTQELWYGL